MKAKKNKKAERALAKFQNEANTPEAIKEKGFISDLQLEFYKRPLPDHKFFWASARRTVRRIIEEADLPQRPPATLFLRIHYPFFHKKVQSVLLERLPGQCPKGKEVPAWYPVEAYLIAEQYGLTSYNFEQPEPLIGNLDLIESVAQFYFVYDLPWFSRLLLSISNVFEKIKLAQNPTVTTTELRLQEWNNRYAAFDKTPQKWLEHTEFLTRNESSRTERARKNSSRVMASKINRQRKQTFDMWRNCWVAEFKKLDRQLSSTFKH